MLMRVVIYDVEIAKPISDALGGWEGARAGRCGLSSAVVYDSTTGRYHLYDRATLNQLVEHLNSADLVVGFNNVEFDTPLVESVSNQKVTARQFDILQAVWAATGKKHKGYGLGPICERTLGLSKSGDGESAPKLAAQGRWAELFDYNLNDVHLTKTLFEHITLEGFIIDTSGNELLIDVPEDITL